MYIKSVYFTPYNLLSLICFSPQSLGLCQSLFDSGWTINFSVKSRYAMIGLSNLLRPLENRFWALLLLFTKPEVLHSQTWEQCVPLLVDSLYSAENRGKSTAGVSLWNRGWMITLAGRCWFGGGIFDLVGCFFSLRSLAGWTFRLLVNVLSIIKTLLIHDELHQVQPLNLTV